jgi:hypothetical protein
MYVQNFFYYDVQQLNSWKINNKIKIYRRKDKEKKRLESEVSSTDSKTLGIKTLLKWGKDTVCVISSK